MMVLKQIAELKNRPIDLSDIPEVTPSQAKEFYPRSLKEKIQTIYNLFDKDNLLWLEQNGSSNRGAINNLLEKLRNGTLSLA